MGLNYANLDKLIAVIASLRADQLSMKSYAFYVDDESGIVDDLHQCGTVGCIAGWAEQSFYGRISQNDTADNAQEQLGLTEDQAGDLFWPEGYGSDNSFPPARVVDVLRHLRATGEVDWDRFPYENYVKPKAAWTPPVAVEVKANLPAVLTSLLRPNVAAEPV